MRPFLVFAALILVLPGCLVHRWSTSADGKLIAGYAGTTVVVADAELKRVETYTASGKPAIVEISPDGRWIAYNTEDANELWLVDRTANTQKKIAEAEGIYLYNAWSPNSARFAFVQKTQKGGSMVGALRVYTVKTGETFTAIEECVPAYDWTPSGEAIFAIEPFLRKGDPDLVFGRLVRWTDGADPEVTADVEGVAFVEALSEDEVLFTSSIDSLPRKPVKNPFEELPMGLFRASRKSGTVSRVGTAEIGWVSPSPDGKRLLAFVIERPKGEKMKVRLELFDAQGASVRVIKDSAAYEKGGPLVPLWLGNDRVLVPLGEDESQRFEIHRVDGKDREDVTDRVKAWTK
ncbi:MAG: hypothetical protein K8T20_12390 [Planctomycetes bacterium]|nr:hypothetical protein [Planctomycetota bacterium]